MGEPLQVWTCPDCRRQFGRRRQGHACQPGLSVEEYFASGPPFERPVFDAVMAHVATLGPIVVEPVQVGVFFKTSRTIFQLRPRGTARRGWVALSFSLDRKVESDRFARKVVEYSGRYHYTVNLRTPEDVDEQVRAWLSECYTTG